MKSKAETGSSALDTAKLLFAIAIFGAGVVAFYYFGQQPLLYRALGIVAVAAVAIGVAMTSAQGQSTWSFMREARGELRKVVWPTRQETVQTTIIVMVMVIIVALILWGLDAVFVRVINALIGWGS